MKAVWMLMSLALVAGVRDKAVASPPAPPLAATGAFFALSVADLDASTRWYVETLGLKVVLRTPRQDKAAVVVLEGRGLIVELIQHDDAVPLGRAAPGVKDHMLVHGLVKAGVVVEDFNGLVASLRSRAVRMAFGPY